MQATIFVIDVAKREFVLDIEPEATRGHKIFKHVFDKGEVPDHVDAVETKGPPGKARWIFKWTSSNQMQRVLHRRYQTAFMSPSLYTYGWRTWRESERREYQQRREAILEWGDKLRPEFGNRSATELLQMEPGAYQTVTAAGKGGGHWIWIGHNRRTGRRQLQYYKISGYDPFDNDIRSFLEHGTSLNEALRLQVAQFNRIFVQKLAAFAAVLADGAAMGIGQAEAAWTEKGWNFLEKHHKLDRWLGAGEKIIGTAMANDYAPTPGHRHAVQAVTKAMQQHRDEKRIQEIARRPVRRVNLLTPR